MPVQQRLRRACTAIKEHTAVGYAKLATAGWHASDVELTIVKATAPNDVPLLERYVHELLKVLTFSPTSSRAFSLWFTRRLGNTGCWRVALKCLALLHRLLRALPDCSSTFHSDLRWARSNGLLFLDPCRFRDRSSSASEHYTLFISSYARLLDMALDCCFIGKPFDHDKGAVMEENMIQSLPKLLGMMERAVECMPTGVAKQSFLVRSSMKQIVRDSILCYEKLQKDSFFLLDNIFRMQQQRATSAMNVLKRAATQRVQLDGFFDSCKEMGLCGYYEYPLVDKVPSMEYIEPIESFLLEMWQLKESSSSSDSRSTSDSPANMQLARLETCNIITTKWEKFEEEEEEDKEEWLIRFEDDQEPCWEVLLEEHARMQRATIDLLTSPPLIPRKFTTRLNDMEVEQLNRDESQCQMWEMQVCNENPFALHQTLNSYLGIEEGREDWSCGKSGSMDMTGWPPLNEIEAFEFSRPSSHCAPSAI